MAEDVCAQVTLTTDCLYTS